MHTAFPWGTKVVTHSPPSWCHTKPTANKEVKPLVNWLDSLHPSLPQLLEEQGIAPEWVEAKHREQCCTSLAYRHRLTNEDNMEMSMLRFDIRIDLKC